LTKRLIPVGENLYDGGVPTATAAENQSGALKTFLLTEKEINKLIL
jgi:hypothetical protein